ncbi:MAG: hypothetical protein U0487_03340 [Patescibacteria group bacterium]
METHQQRHERGHKGRIPTLKEQFAQSATDAALARYNQDLDELKRLAEGEDPPDED